MTDIDAGKYRTDIPTVEGTRADEVYRFILNQDGWVDTSVIYDNIDGADRRIRGTLNGLYSRYDVERRPNSDTGHSKEYRIEKEEE